MCNDQQEFIMDEAIWRISELGMNNTSVNVSSLATPLVHWSTGTLDQIHSTFPGHHHYGKSGPRGTHVPKYLY